MKRVTRNVMLFSFSAIIIAGVFVFGFYTGTNTEVADSFSGDNNGNEDSYTDRNTNYNQSEFDEVDMTSFWRVWNILDEKFVETGDATMSEEERIYGAIEGMVESLDDPYTAFFPPVENEAFQEDIRGNFEGVGMEIGERDDVITVVAPLKGSPAIEAGMRAGDIILQIDGESTRNLNISEAVELIRGEKGTVVELFIAREEVDEPFKISITRDVIKLPTLETENREDGVFVISLFNFGQNSTRDFRDALKEFTESKTDKLILDLRGNPGGFLDASVEIASWFLPSGKVIVREDFGKGEEDMKVLRSKGYDVFNDKLKMVVLIDEGSASASEIVAGALSEHGLATLVGQTTFGKGSVQELVEITDQTSLKVTVAQWLTPNGNSISDGGLDPDIFIELDPLDLESDLQLEKAVEILLNQ